ncbi:hypothetical protein PROFUN_10986 [Planoprotostelium fungivorum]|uniref:EamA domain-containing protein n=1 Tax=Planoprotostelium fungivorum TaxID=1890364 RepID=A0A2P6NBW6_9EUKA|nr:hypothetical protein PROFUN_10986 [Planoprotostelium fungivorum]
MMEQTKYEGLPDDIGHYSVTPELSRHVPSILWSPHCDHKHANSRMSREDLRLTQLFSRRSHCVPLRLEPDTSRQGRHTPPEQTIVHVNEKSDDVSGGTKGVSEELDLELGSFAILQKEFDSVTFCLSCAQSSSVPHSPFFCTSMKSLSLLLFACLLTVASARPAAFRNSVPVDGTGSRRLVEDIGDHTVSRSVKFLPQLVLLDEVDELLSLTCYGPDRFVLVFNASVPSWTNNFPVLGGAEWGCVDDEGKAVSPSLYVLNVTVQGHTVELTGRRPELDEVYESFSMNLARNEDKKRVSASGSFNAGSFNYDYQTGSAISTIPLFYQDCLSNDLSPKAEEFCQLNGKLSNNITCTNCFTHNQLSITISFGLFDGLNFYASGSLNLHAEFDLAVPAEIVREVEIMSRSLPLTGIPDFGAVSFGGFLDIKLTALVGWQNQGNLHGGFDMNVNYGLNNWTPYNNHQFQLIKPTGSQGGDARFRLTFTVGPAFRIRALGTTVVDTSITFNPWVEVDVGFAVSQPFPALATVPTASDSYLYDASYVSACYTDHYLNFNVPFGYQTIFVLKGWAVPDKTVTLQNYVSVKPLAQGCLLPASSRIIKQIQFLFDKGVVIRNNNVTTQTFVSLFLQDLSFVLKDKLVAGVDVSFTLNSGGHVEVSVVVPQGSDFNDSNDQYARLSQLSRDPSSLRDNARSSQISRFLVANVPPTTANPEETYNLLSSSAAVSHSIPLVALVLASTMAVLWFIVFGHASDFRRLCRSANCIVPAPSQSVSVFLGRVLLRHWFYRSPSCFDPIMAPDGERMKVTEREKISHTNFSPRASRAMDVLLGRSSVDWDRVPMIQVDGEEIQPFTNKSSPNFSSLEEVSEMEDDCIELTTRWIEDSPTTDLESNIKSRRDSPPTSRGLSPWLLLAILSHFAWGTYPVLARYLQTSATVPSFSLLVIANVPCSIVSLVIIVYRGRLLDIMRSKMLPIIIIVSAVRAATNLIAPKYTSAIYVQLITLSTPYMVAGLNAVASIERLPRGTIPCVILTTVGAALMVVSSSLPLQLELTKSDVIGFALSFLSALFLALYMILVKKMTGGDKGVPGEELLFFMTFPLVFLGSIVSLSLGESWSIYNDLTLPSWLSLVGISVLCNLCGNFLQVTSIRLLGSSMVSSLMAFRLVSSLLMSYLLMHEIPKSVAQLFGAAIVLCSITWYLWRQR